MKVFFLIICFLNAFQSIGQTPLLERRITVVMNDESVESSLKKVADAGGFVFSYNPEIIDRDKRVNSRFVNRTVREVLDEIFKGAVRYKTRGKYIILTRSKEKTRVEDPAVITGYVVDEATGERLRDVSIYDPVTLSSTISDSYGYFEIKIDRPSPDLILSVNRQNYADTLVVVPSRNRLLKIPIRADKDRLSVIADSIEQKAERFWSRQVLWFEGLNFINIDDTLYRKTQVSLFPFVGTNHKMSGHVINDYSFNIVAGYALGMRRLEIGGLANMNRGEVKGFQFAGGFNLVGGEMNAAQFAGIANINQKESRGVQAAGVANIDLHPMRGPQLAGVANITTGDQVGPQVAGVFNLAAKRITGPQIAGVFNTTVKDMRGVQISGVMNLAGKKLQGAQISGVLNYAKKVEGLQLGLVNIADTVKGIPIGLLSLVWKGYHKIEVSADEVFYNNVSFRTGVHAFYNIFTAGAKPSTYKREETFWTFGYGVGTAPRLGRKLFLNLDLTANQIMEGNRFKRVNLLNKFYLGLDYQFLRKMSLAFGATLNGYVTEMPVDDPSSLFEDYQPDIFYDRDLGSGHNLKMWIGGRVALRFL